jgi:hypothetical protein
MSTLFVMDSRVPMSPTADPNDPSNPTNVTKRAIMLERQAHADGEFDIKAPIRQGFQNEEAGTVPTTATNPYILLLAILVGSVLVALLVCHKYNYYIKCAIGAGAIYAFHYAASLIPST